MTASLRNSIEGSIKVKGDFQEDLALTYEQNDKIDFQIIMDKKTNEWSSYLIPFARQQFLLSDSSTLTLELKNLRFTRSGRCVPQSGTITVSMQGARDRRFSGVINPQADIVLQAEDGGESLLLSPFGCVLKEG